jgi:phosphatidylinositol glycan class B
MLPANVFMPVVLALILLAVVAWVRCPGHPVTWATLPFALVHNLVAHKEERFLFPLAILSTAFVTMALAPSSEAPLASKHAVVRSLRSAANRIAAWGFRRRRGWPARTLVAASSLPMLLLAFVPLGWHHNVRFARFVHEHIGEELHATVLPEIELNLPPFHPRIYDVDKADEAEIVRLIEAGTAREWLITDRPVLTPELSARVTLVYSEMPTYRDSALMDRSMRLVAAYNAHAVAPLRRLRFRSLYRIPRPTPAPE